MTDVAQAFQNDYNNTSDAVNEIGPLDSQVLPSHNAKSHDFFDAHGGIYSVNVFPSPLFTLTLFHTSQKLPQASVKTFWQIKAFLFEIQRFHHSKCA